MKRLEGKVVIVTGASSGVGRAIAILSAQEGASVVCADIRRDPIPNKFDKSENVATDQVIREAGTEAVYVTCDISKSEQVDNLIQTAVEKFGRLDVLFNNAGIMTGQGTILDKTEAELDRCISVNLKGLWFCCRSAIRQFKKQGAGGKIVNMSSICGVAAAPFVPDYCATKAAVTNLTRQLALDFGPDNIHINAVCPSNIATSMMQASPQEELDSLVAKTPLHRGGTPMEVAHACVFLGSSESNYITGQALLIDGGLSCSY